MLFDGEKDTALAMTVLSLDTTTTSAKDSKIFSSIIGVSLPSGSRQPSYTKDKAREEELITKEDGKDKV